MTGLVVDLRNNGGGILDQAKIVAEQFLAQGQTILTQKGRGTRGMQRELSSDNRKPDPTPLVVLVNRGTASASEIVAGAWQDHDRALIIGETSFGKGLVQSIMPLEYGTALTLTTSKYYTPSGRLIQRDYSNQSYYDYIYGRVNGTQEEAAGREAEGQRDAHRHGPPHLRRRRHRARRGRQGAHAHAAADSSHRPDLRLRPRGRERPRAGRAAELQGRRDARVRAQRRAPTAFVVDDKVYKAFKEFAVAHYGEELKLTEAQLDKGREFIARQLRYDLTTAAYGSVKATQVLDARRPAGREGHRLAAARARPRHRRHARPQPAVEDVRGVDATGAARARTKRPGESETRRAFSSVRS